MRNAKHERKRADMRCPSCGYEESKVVDSRPSDDSSFIRRRRECLKCSYRFTTYERLGENPLVVVKSDGSSEAFDRDKLFRGILKACAKRQVDPKDVSALVDDVENTLRRRYANSISSKEIGGMVLERLSKIDDVAYIRFASVYQDFQSVEEFVAAIEKMK